jgi:16S rRNA (guanine966-N2)-methyltransferase
MRITGGSWRGRRLAVPRGRDVRPTNDRVREALFAILQHNDFGRPGGPVLPGDETRVLDACAGSGALGLEALSRGAAHATFFDIAGAALDCVTANIETLGAGDRTTVRRADATRPPPADAACALVLLDPPWRSDVAARALSALAAAGWLAADAIVVVEHGGGNAPAAPDGFIEVDRRTYGATSLLLLRYGA